MCPHALLSQAQSQLHYEGKTVCFVTRPSKTGHVGK